MWPYYNWLSFAITYTIVFKRQMLIRITILKSMPIKNLPVVMVEERPFVLLEQTKHSDVISSEAITKLTTIK